MKQESGGLTGLLLLRRITPLTRRNAVYFCSGAYTNALWRAPRIHGELLKLGIKISERTVSRILRVKGGVKTDHWGGVKVDQWVGRRSGIVGEEGVWSGGLRRLKGGAFRPERKTSSSPSVFTAVGVGGRRIRSSAVSLACACSASGGSSRRSSPECGRGG